MQKSPPVEVGKAHSVALEAPSLGWVLVTLKERLEPGLPAQEPITYYELESVENEDGQEVATGREEYRCRAIEKLLRGY